MKSLYTLTIIISTFLVQTALAQDYCDGWAKGYESGYIYISEVNGSIPPIFTTPTCPVAKIGYDTYQDGYNRGFEAGRKEFDRRNPDVELEDRIPTIIDGNTGGDFCDGWKKGYDAGYSYVNTNAGKLKPIFIIPICPIANIDQDSYNHGYSRGFEQGKRILPRAISIF